MATLIDLVGSVFIGAFVILLGIDLNQSVAGSVDAAAASVNVQESLVEIVQWLEHDLRKIGYGVTDPKNAIVISSPGLIRFKADMNRDGVTDNVDWYIANPHRAASGDTVYNLYRKMNSNTPELAGVDITTFSLRYLKEDGAPADTTTKSQIWIVETTLKVQSPYEVADDVKGNDELGTVKGFWRQTRLASRNIKRHG